MSTTTEHPKDFSQWWLVALESTFKFLKIKSIQSIRLFILQMRITKIVMLYLAVGHTWLCFIILTLGFSAMCCTTNLLKHECC